MNSLYDVFILKNDRHLPPVNPLNSLINNFNNDNELHTEREREREGGTRINEIVYLF